jgi:hypothetical protein
LWVSICCDAPHLMSYVALGYFSVLLWCCRADGLLVAWDLISASVMLYFGGFVIAPSIVHVVGVGQVNQCLLVSVWPFLSTDD